MIIEPERGAMGAQYLGCTMTVAIPDLSVIASNSMKLAAALSVRLGDMSAQESPDPIPDISLASPKPLLRRQMFGFLAGVATSVPLAAWWTRRRDSAPAQEPESERTSVPAETKAARPASTKRRARAGRPRLMIAIPSDTEAQYELGKAFGEYLNHGTDESLAPLALVHVECVANDELLLPSTAEGQGPFALLVASESERLLRFALPPAVELSRDDDERIAQQIDQRIAAVAAAVHDAILAQHRLPQLWPHIAEALDPRASDVIKRLRRNDFVAPSEVDRFAPEIMNAALEEDSSAHSILTAALAGQVRRRLIEGTVHGSEWARAGGCGSRVEGRKEAVLFGCGMGFVPARSQRFLRFYTSGDSHW